MAVANLSGLPADLSREPLSGSYGAQRISLHGGLTEASDAQLLSTWRIFGTHYEAVLAHREGDHGLWPVCDRRRAPARLCGDPFLPQVDSGGTLDGCAVLASHAGVRAPRRRGWRPNGICRPR